MTSRYGRVYNVCVMSETGGGDIPKGSEQSAQTPTRASKEALRNLRGVLISNAGAWISAGTVAQLT